MSTPTTWLLQRFIHCRIGYLNNLCSALFLISLAGWLAGWLAGRQSGRDFSLPVSLPPALPRISLAEPLPPRLSQTHTYHTTQHDRKKQHSTQSTPSSLPNPGNNRRCRIATHHLTSPTHSLTHHSPLTHSPTHSSLLTIIQAIPPRRPPPLPLPTGPEASSQARERMAVTLGALTAVVVEI